MSNYGYNVAAAKSVITVTAVPRPVRKIKKVKLMKLTFKQRIRNWLNNNNNDLDPYTDQDLVKTVQLVSDGMRLQIYKANGGFVVETSSYDRRKDQNNNTMHVITEDQDLGDALGKIVMMETLRG